MNHRLMKKCIDMNSPYCPCLLADTNHCTFCGMLRGEGVCDCDWSGTCILYEKFWRDKAKKKSAVCRAEEETRALSQRQIGDKTYLVEFSVGEELARGLQALGSFVFLRRTSDPAFGFFPVGVMKADGQTISVAIETIGAKSSRFILNRDEKIIVRGPYRNGVLGGPWIENLSGGKVALLAGGIGQAPALPILKTLAGHKNKVLAIAAPGKVGKIFIEEECAKLGVELYKARFLREDGFERLEKLFAGDLDLLVSAGPDAQHSGVIRMMSARGVDLPMAATNNAVMCCGEGICGSCERLTQDGKCVKMCKTQIDYGSIMQD